MRKRLPFHENGVIAKLNGLDTKIALVLSQSLSSYLSIAIHFLHFIPQIKLNELDGQWRILQYFSKKTLQLLYVFLQYW